MSVRERLHLAAQQLLPLGLLTRLVHWLTRQRRPRWLKNLAIRTFVRAFAVNMAESVEPEPSAYPDFNAFFTRALKPGLRPLAAEREAVASPVDGAVSELGSIEQGRLLQAKGLYYTVAELLGGSGDGTAAFQGGSFVTLYLSPRDYHRIHMPCAGTLRQMIYLPGGLHSVSPATVRTIPQLFARNERVACLFDGELGPLALVLVGAVNVAAIETVWAGLVAPPRGGGPRRVGYPDAGQAGAVSLGRGEELGRFNMGSTVVMLLGRGDLAWDRRLVAGAPVRLGEALGRVMHAER